MAGNLQFGQRIRELREAKKRTDPAFSLRQFAEALNLSATFISKMETGQFDPPSAENIKKMAELLGADPYELLQLAQKPDPELVEMEGAAQGDGRLPAHSAGERSHRGRAYRDDPEAPVPGEVERDDGIQQPTIQNRVPSTRDY